MTKFNFRAPLEKISQLQQSNEDQVNTLIGQLAYTDAITFLFDLSVYFEEQYAHLGPDKRMQVVGLWLSKLVKAAFNKKALPSPKKPDEAVQIQLLNRLVHLNETGLDETLMKLCQLYDSNEFLDTFQQIHQHDDNCEVLAYEEGCIRTVIKEGRFAGLQHYIRDGLKYEKLVPSALNNA